MPDLNFQDFSTVQSDKQPYPYTLASAATITPAGFITVVTGAVAINFITPPVSGAHMLVLLPAAAATFALTAGAGSNIAGAVAAAVAGMPVLLFYNPGTKKYYALKGTTL